MDLKIQHSCGLTTLQLKSSGFSFPQTNPHCALHRSTAAVIPTRGGYAEAVMTIHFSRCHFYAFGRKEICTIDPLEWCSLVRGLSELGNNELCSMRVLLGY